MTIVTQRVEVTPTANNTKRVATSVSVVIAVAASFGTSVWGKSWGGFVSAGGDRDDSWGRTWSTASPSIASLNTKRVSPVPVANNTKRVTAIPTANNTKRVIVA